QEELLGRLAAALAQVTLVGKQLDERSVNRRLFRVVLVGPSNAGKSSLFNALGGEAAALVSPQPGTTRDYLVRHLQVAGVGMELVDTAGWQAACDNIEEQAQALGRGQAEEADLILLCVEAGRPLTAEEARLLGRQGSPAVVGVATKCDLQPA